jgi:hypothetical protein
MNMNKTLHLPLKAQWNTRGGLGVIGNIHDNPELLKGGNQ